MDLETLKGTVVHKMLEYRIAAPALLPERGIEEEFSRVHTQIFLFEMFSL